MPLAIPRRMVQEKLYLGEVDESVEHWGFCGLYGVTGFRPLVEANMALASSYLRAKVVRVVSRAYIWS